MKHYNYEKQNDSQNDYKPRKSYLCLDYNGNIYMNRFDDGSVLTKSTNKGVSWSEIHDTTFFYIRGFWIDWTNGYLYVHWVGDSGIKTWHVIYKYEMDNSDNQTKLHVGDFAWETEASEYFDEEGSDIYEIGSDLYTDGRHLEVGVGYGLKIYKYNSGTNSWDLEDYWLAYGSQYTVNKAMSRAIVIGTNSYKLFQRNDPGQIAINLLKFTSTTSTISSIWDSTSYNVLQDMEQRTLVYDDSDKIYFVLNKISDGKKYLCSWSISGSSFTQLGEYDVVLMDDRFVDPSANPPFNREKGFAVDERKIYQFPQNYNGLLFLISSLETVIADGVIKGITNKSLFIERTSTTVEIWEFVDVSSSMIKVEFVHEIQKASYGTLGVVRDEITITKGMFMQIIGTFATANLPRVYKGTYNFEDESVGTSGTDIGFIDSGGGDALHCVIEASYLTHKKVMSFYDDDGYSMAYHSMTQATAGTREFFIAVNDNTCNFRIYFQEGTGDGNLCFHLLFNVGQIRDWNADNITVLSNATYFHLKVIWFADNTASVYINGDLLVDGLAMANNQVSGIDTITLRGYINDADKKLYIDAWGDPDNDANYDVGDNLVVEGGETDQVIFEGIVIDFDGERLQKVWLESPAKKELDRKPRGDFSGRSDEIMTSLVSTYCKYITIGTLSSGTAMGTITYAGDKTLQTIFNELTLFEKWVWKLGPQGRLYFNDGTVDTLVDLSKTDKIWMVKTGEIREPYNYFYLKGAIVDGVQLVKELEEADDLASQQLHGFNPFEKTFASFNAQGILDQLTSNAKAKLKETPLMVEHWHYDADLGMLAIMETITLVYDTTNMNVASDQFLINRVLFKAEQNAGGYTIADKLV